MSFLTGSAVGAFQALSLGLDVFSSIREGQVNKANLLEQAAADRFDAEVAEQLAVSEMEGAAADAVDFRRAQSARAAASRAAAAGSGFTMEGSPMMVDAATLSEIEFGVSRIIGQAQVRAHRLRQEGTLLRRKADVGVGNARRALTAGVIGAVSSTVRGVGGAIADYREAARSSPTVGVGSPLDIRPPLITGGVAFG